MFNRYFFYLRLHNFEDCLFYICFLNTFHAKIPYVDPQKCEKASGFFYFFRLIGNGTLTCDILYITPRDILIVRIVAVETNKIMHSIKWTFSLNYCMVILSVE